MPLDLLRLLAGGDEMQPRHPQVITNPPTQPMGYAPEPAPQFHEGIKDRLLAALGDTLGQAHINFGSRASGGQVAAGLAALLAGRVATQGAQERRATNRSMRTRETGNVERRQKDVDRAAGLSDYAAKARIDAGFKQASTPAKAEPWQLPPDQRAGYIDFKRRESEATRAPRAPEAVQTKIIIDPTTGKPKYVSEADAVGMEPGSVKDTAKNRPATAGERGLMADRSAMIQQIEKLRGLYSPRFVGPVHGRLGGLGQKIPGVPGDQQGDSFRATLAGIRNTILKLRSGGAVTPSEAERLLKELPTENDKSGNFEAKMDTFEDSYRATAKAQRDVIAGSGVDLSDVPDLPERGVKMRAPDGTVRMVPAQKVDGYKARGARVVR